MNILITAIGTATSVGVIKTIRNWQKSKGVEVKVYGTDINPYGYTAFSQKVDRFYQVPLAKDIRYKTAIIEILENEKIDLFWPIQDDEIRLASEWQLPDRCKMIVADKGVIELVQDKITSTERIESLGLPVPDRIYGDYDSKAIIRKCHGVGSNGIRIVDGFLKSDLEADSFAQRYIEGSEYTVDCLCNLKGEPMYIVPRKRIEVKSGVATKSLIEENKTLIDYTKRVLSSLRLPGFSNTQWIVMNDTPYYIETNPRIGGGASATLISAPSMFDSFMNIVIDEKGTQHRSNDSEPMNNDVKWGSVITRYYEEVLYLPGR